MGRNLSKIVSLSGFIYENKNVLSTQNMIYDARARSLQKVRENRCDECDFKSISKTLLKRHQKSCHKEVQYACDQCDYKATTKGSLAEHKQTYHKEVQYACDQCDYKVTTKAPLSNSVNGWYQHDFSVPIKQN